MAEIQVTVISKQDSENGKRMYPKLHPEDVRESEKPMKVGLLEGGMQSGRTSVTIAIENPDGTVSTTQCSARNIEQLYHVVKGVQQRFGDE